jgi:hypothetical protein
LQKKCSPFQLAAHLENVEIGCMLLTKTNAEIVYAAAQSQPLGVYKILNNVDVVEVSRISSSAYLLRSDEIRFFGSDLPSKRITTEREARERYKLFSWKYAIRRYMPFSGEIAEVIDNSNTNFNATVSHKNRAIATYSCIEYSIPVYQAGHPSFISSCLAASTKVDKIDLFGNAAVYALTGKISMSKRFCLVTIALCVEYVWRHEVILIHILYTSFYVLYLALITVSNYGSSEGECSERYAPGEPVYFAMVFVNSINTALVGLETSQLYTSYKEGTLRIYFTEPFNLIQWASYILIFVGQYGKLERPCDSNSEEVMAYATVLVFGNFLYYLRPFRGPGLLVRMIICIAWEVRWMMFIMFVFVLGFSQSFFLNSYEHGSAASKYFDRGNSVLQAYATIAGSPNFEGGY